MKYLVTTLCASVFISGCATHNTSITHTKDTDNKTAETRPVETNQHTNNTAPVAEKKSPAKSKTKGRDAIKSMLDGTSVHIVEETPKTISVE